MGPDPRTPAQKDAEGRAALEQLLSREGLFGWGPVVRRALPALAEAVAEHTAKGAISPETAHRAAIAVQTDLLLSATPGFGDPAAAPSAARSGTEG